MFFVYFIFNYLVFKLFKFGGPIVIQVSQISVKEPQLKLSSSTVDEIGSWSFFISKTSV
jgi:hypothetical protein